MARVFVSYAKEDREIAEQIVAALIEAGHDVWWDDRLTPRAHFDALIEKEIDKADAVVVLWTKASIHSEWVRAEAHYGEDRLVPLLLDEVKVPLAFQMRQCANLSGWQGDKSDREWRRALSWIAAQYAAGDEKPQAPETESTNDPLPENGSQISSPEQEQERETQPKPDKTVRIDNALPERKNDAAANSEKKFENIGAREAVIAGVALFAVTAIILAFVFGARVASGCVVKLPDARRLSAQVKSPLLATPSCAAKPFATFRDCETCPQMVTIPAGAFNMGSSIADGGDDDEHPVHAVTIKHAFAISRMEVTWSEWLECVNDGVCIDNGNARTDRTGYLPVFAISWENSQSYLEWLSKKTGEQYRLPSESEWEYAARAGSVLRYSATSEESAVCRHANVRDRKARDTYGENPKEKKKKYFPCDDRHAYRSRGGRFARNSFGLYDMIGNVLEPVADCYIAGYNDAPIFGEPRRSEECAKRIFRGGSHYARPSQSTVSFRWPASPGHVDSRYGLRVARDIH